MANRSATKSAATGLWASTEVTNTPGSCFGQSSRTRAKRPSYSSRMTVRTVSLTEDAGEHLAQLARGLGAALRQMADRLAEAGAEAKVEVVVPEGVGRARPSVDKLGGGRAGVADLAEGHHGGSGFYTPRALTEALMYQALEFRGGPSGCGRRWPRSGSRSPAGPVHAWRA